MNWKNLGLDLQRAECVANDLLSRLSLVSLVRGERRFKSTNKASTNTGQQWVILFTTQITMKYFIFMLKMDGNRDNSQF